MLSHEEVYLSNKIQLILNFPFTLINHLDRLKFEINPTVHLVPEARDTASIYIYIGESWNIPL